MLSVFFPPDGWITSVEMKMAWRAIKGPASIFGIQASFTMPAEGLEIRFYDAPHYILCEWQQLAPKLFPWLQLGEIENGELHGFIPADAFPAITRIIPKFE